MSNPTVRNEQDRSPKSKDSGAEINQETQRRLMTGEKPGEPAAEEKEAPAGHTIADRVAAVQSTSK